jgi:hypothetical protein
MGKWTHPGLILRNFHCPSPGLTASHARSRTRRTSKPKFCSEHGLNHFHELRTSLTPYLPNINLQSCPPTSFSSSKWVFSKTFSHPNDQCSPRLSNAEPTVPLEMAGTNYGAEPPVMHPLKNLQAFMEPEVSLPLSQEPSTCPYPKPDQFSPYHPIIDGTSKPIFGGLYTLWNLWAQLCNTTNLSLHLFTYRCL